jgi:carbamoyltransferase
MIILGLNAFHADSSAALVRDGKLIAAVEEERFRRIKHWAGFPSQAIAYCLKEAGIGLSDVDHIAFNQDSRANLLRKATYFITKRPNINLVLRRLRNRRSRAGDPRTSGANVPRRSHPGSDPSSGTSFRAPFLGFPRLPLR